MGRTFLKYFFEISVDTIVPTHKVTHASCTFKKSSYLVNMAYSECPAKEMVVWTDRLLGASVWLFPGLGKGWKLQGWILW